LPNFCEICGKRMPKPGRVHLVDGAKVILCESCYNRVAYSTRTPTKPRIHTRFSGMPGEHTAIPSLGESIDLVEGYGKRVRAARERLGLSQEDLAKKLSERATLIRKIEQEAFHPPDAMGRKIEDFLKIKIFEERTGLDTQGFEQYVGKPAGMLSLEEAMRRKKQRVE